jgi:hypothetical protein
MKEFFKLKICRANNSKNVIALLLLFENQNLRMVKIEKSRRRIVFGVCLGVYIIYSHCSWLQPECVRIIQNETQTKVASHR